MEYKIIFWGDGTNKDSFEKTINKMAQDGWRVVCSMGESFLIMERHAQTLPIWNAAEVQTVSIPAYNPG